MHMLHSQIHQNNASATNSSSSSGNRISPAILFTIIILSIVFFILGLIHLLLRFITRKSSSSSSSSSSSVSQETSESSYAYYHQRQLQQLFHLHDSGLDQPFIDSLPVFLYKEIIGLKEPFDCAVCLSEFSVQDKLRLLPNCNHAFHIDCIDTWLLSNSTCPLCRGTLSIETPFFGFEGFPFEEENDGVSAVEVGENHIMCGKRVFSVRLGKFRSSNNEDVVEKRGEGECSSSSGNGDFDVRRCYSMGSYEYVVDSESDLRVALFPSMRKQQQLKGRTTTIAEATNGDVFEGKKMNNNIARKGESFSVSKIWQWSRKDDDRLRNNNNFIGREQIP